MIGYVNRSVDRGYILIPSLVISSIKNFPIMKLIPPV